jgi:hypothetical protein
MHDKRSWRESRNAVVRGLRERLETELCELENPALLVAARRQKAASAAHIEESLRSIQEARSAREYEIAYHAFLLGCMEPDTPCH